MTCTTKKKKENTQLQKSFWLFSTDFLLEASLNIDPPLPPSFFHALPQSLLRLLPCFHGKYIWIFCGCTNAAILKADDAIKQFQK